MLDAQELCKLRSVVLVFLSYDIYWAASKSSVFRMRSSGESMAVRELCGFLKVLIDMKGFLISLELFPCLFDCFILVQVAERGSSNSPSNASLLVPCGVIK